MSTPVYIASPQEEEAAHPFIPGSLPYKPRRWLWLALAVGFALGWAARGTINIMTSKDACERPRQWEPTQKTHFGARHRCRCL